MRFATVLRRPLLVVGALLFWLSSFAARADLWVTGYYPGYEQNYLAPTNIDFTALTHIIHFSLVPNTDGTLDASPNVITPKYSTNLVTVAHAAGKKVLISIGGGGGSTEPGFLGATSAGNLNTFVHNLTNFVAQYNYDGIDIDWEPLPMTDFGQFTNFIITLRSALDRFPQRKLLTAAIGAYPNYGDPPASSAQMIAGIQNKFDQVNLMTYDLSGPWGEHACQAKVSYARNKRLGGVMIWELGEGYRATQPAGQRDLLLQAIKKAMATPGKIVARKNGPDMQLQFGAAPLGLYKVEWSSNVVSPTWNTLTNNVTSTNGTVEVLDAGAATSQPRRYYRVQTPP